MKTTIEVMLTTGQTQSITRKEKISLDEALEIMGLERSEVVAVRSYNA